MPEHQDLHFPDGFLWGASTSSHQVEGNTQNDWSEWEQSEKRLDELKRSGQLDRHGLDNFISAEAANHFHLYKEDYALAEQMGHNAMRLSLEWSRIEPREGEFDTEALKKYQMMLAELNERGIEPFVTLYHWTIPTWFRDKGSWLHRDAPQIFARFVEKTVSFLRTDVRFWVTLNEPEVYTSHAYFLGLWPPQKKSVLAYFRVTHTLAKAHKLAYQIIKKLNPNAQVGIAKNNIYFEPYSANPLNHLFRHGYHWFWNEYFLDRIKHHQDYIGLNYYFHNKVQGLAMRNENKLISDLGWELHPEGIYHVLKALGTYKKPIYITENGLADATDKSRAWFIVNILKYIHQAIDHGVDVRGYLHWSLIDNFEWHQGYHPRFGLVEVDYKTQTRKVRPSAHVYSDIIKNNKVHKELLDKHKKHPDES